MSQRELGELVGIGRATISMIERGDRRPSMRVLLALAREFEMSVEEITKSLPKLKYREC